jgi:hypothetical protein
LVVVGARIWALIVERSSVRAVCEELLDEYDVDAPTCEQATLNLLVELQRVGLVDVADARAA